MTPKTITASILLGTAAFLVSHLITLHPAPVAASTSKTPAASYTCPMHPAYKSNHPGDCPSCGMRLVLAETSPAESSAAAPGKSVDIGPNGRQLISAQTAEVRQGAASYALRLSGRVAVDEDRQYRIMAGADGWVRDLGQNASGVFVKKNQVLASYYTPNLVAATQTFVFALQTNAQAQSGDATIGYQRGTTVLSLQVALDSLRSLGMSDLQIEEIRRTRVAPDRIDIYSPADGFVIARNLSPQQRFDKGTELYRIADLRRVWVLADVFEKDRDLVHPGATAIVRYAGREFPARMSAALPQFDPQSRTIKARFELDNSAYLLRPEMYADVEIRVNMPSAVTAPADAVIDTGLRKLVYVDSGAGRYSPRVIKTGWRAGDRVQVTEGLNPGERVVVDGAFLIDSESRIVDPSR